jgi:bifunctional polynucleotide phosphatase/kinase
MSMSIYYINGQEMKANEHDFNRAQMKAKIAAFDYDWTLVSPKDGKTFPSNVEDWAWLYPNIPDMLKRLNEEGFTIVIFTNQSKDWKVTQIQTVASSLEIPIFIVIAMQKCDYKPNPVLYDVLVGSHTFDKDASFFVGDALGRKGDWADSDKVFAQNIGLKCHSPEEFFSSKHEDDVVEIPELNLSDCKQVIIMVGYPGSGKSSVAKKICEDERFVLVQGDVYKTSSKMIKAAGACVSEGKSVVFDATNSSYKKRYEYIGFARKHSYKIVCVHVSTSLDVSYKRNKMRDPENQVPKIAYSMYTKHFENPSVDEGFELIVL